LTTGVKNFAKRQLPYLSLLALTVIGCNGPLSPQAKELLLSAYRNYEAGNNAAVISLLDEFLADRSSTSRADEGYYLRGMAKYRSSDRSGAADDLNAALERTANSQLRAKARIALGDMAYDAGDMALAENMYRQALTDIPKGKKPADHARFRLGCVLQRQGRWADADLQFDRVIYLFRGSDIAQQAARRTHSVAWTIQAGAYRNKSLAESEAAKLSSKDLPAEVEVVLLEGEPAFIVQLGRFPTYEQAMASLPTARKIRAGAFVAPTR